MVTVIFLVTFNRVYWTNVYVVNVSVLCSRLLDAGCDVNRCTRDGTSLHVAVAGGHLDVVVLLLAVTVILSNFQVTWRVEFKKLQLHDACGILVMCISVLTRGTSAYNYDMLCKYCLFGKCNELICRPKHNVIFNCIFVKKRFRVSQPMTSGQCLQ